MMNKAILTTLIVLLLAAGAMAQGDPDEVVTDRYTGPAKPSPTTVWVSVVMAVVFVGATVAVAFKDPRRTHLDERK